MEKFILSSPLDMHLHLRDGYMLEQIAPFSAQTFSGALVMPNLVPPITSKEELFAYKRNIQIAVKEDCFVPYMTLFFKSEYDEDFLKSIKSEITAIKLYPQGITTNSHGGVNDFFSEEFQRVLGVMSDLDIPLCVHGETNGFVMDREREFSNIYSALAEKFPRLKIIMEHITTRDSVELLDRHENLYATITLHHLLITLDDVVGGMLKPHLFCKPIAKRPQDREALLEVALSAHPKVMFGSDSAPHPREKKESCGCAAGVFTSPIALQALVELFDKHNKLEKLQAFVSDNARRIYNLSVCEKEICFVKKPYEVEATYGGVVPMFAKETLQWSISKVC